MKILYSLPLLIIIAVGCASSSKDNSKQHSYTNLVKIEKPGSTNHKITRVYVDSVKQITINKKPALLIKGTFPDACTKLANVSHTIINDSLQIHFTAWRNPEELCAQVLTPFSYIYDELSKKEISSHTNVFINNTAYSYK